MGSVRSRGRNGSTTGEDACRRSQHGITSGEVMAGDSVTVVCDEGYASRMHRHQLAPEAKQRVRNSRQKREREGEKECSQEFNLPPAHACCLTCAKTTPDGLLPLCRLHQIIPCPPPSTRSREKNKE